MKELLQSQIFAGGFLLMITGAVMAILRRVPDDLWYWIKTQFTVKVTIIDSDPIFESLLSWLDLHPYSKKARNLHASTLQDGEEKTTMLSPGCGQHVLKFNGRWMWLTRKRDDSPSANSYSRPIKMETLTLTMLGRSQEHIRLLLDECSDSMRKRQKDKISIYIAEYGYWRKLRGANKRPIGSVVLPNGQAEALLEDCNWFLQSREAYLQTSVPYRRGYCFYGLPGTGKTTTVMALASELNLSLYVLPLSSSDMNDQQLSSLMLMVRPGSIILLEDVDAVNLKREVVLQKNADTPSKSNGVTLSGLLNALDGVAAQEGCMIFMTTNHINSLDEALVRPGRVDVRMEYRSANLDQIERAYRNFFPNANGEARDFACNYSGKAVTMVQVQDALMKMKFRGSEAIQ